MTTDIDIVFLNAVIIDDKPQVVRLLNEGVDINTTWDGCSNALGHSLDKPEMLQLLIDSGANPHHILTHLDMRKHAWGRLGYIFANDVSGTLAFVDADVWIETLKVLQNAGVEIRKPFQTFYDGERTLVNMIEEGMDRFHDDADILHTLRSVYVFLMQ